MIGAGGLGSFAIQYLKILTKARIVVADIAPDKRARALELGADECIDGGLENVSAELLKRTEGRGADAVLDFVGTTATIATSIASRRFASTSRLRLCDLSANVGWPKSIAPGIAPALIPQRASASPIRACSAGDFARSPQSSNTRNPLSAAN